MFATLNIVNKKILIFSFFASILFHACEFHFFQNQKLWIPPKTNAYYVNDVKKIEKEEILKQTFSSMVTTHQGSQNSSKVSQDTPVNHLQTTLPFVENLKVEMSHNFDLPEIKSILSDIKIQSVKIALPQVTVSPNPRLSTYIPRPSLQIPQKPETVKALGIKPENRELSQTFTSEKNSNFTLQTPSLSKTTQKIVHQEPPLQKATLFKRKICKLPSLEDLHCQSVSNFFETDLVFFELKKDHYLFALTLIPKSQVPITPLSQNFYFLLDKSNSIQKERLKATKEAIKKAIHDLEPTDSFNIIAFDQKVDKIAPVCMLATQENKKKADIFLDSIELGSFFSKKDLFNPLFLTLPIENSLHTNTAILFTDGENLENSAQLSLLVNQWTFLNQGKVNLYTVCMDTDAQVETLHALSMYNKGKALASPTLKGFKRKLSKLIKTIKQPIAQGLTIKAISQNGIIDTYPKPFTAPILHLNEPYTIVGSTSNLEDFTLFIQGKLDGKWLHIKKQISFKDAKKASPHLKSLWAQQKAFDLYTGYVLESNSEKLTQAQQLIKTFQLPEIFEKF